MTFNPLCPVCIDMLASEYGIEEPHEAHAPEPEFDPCVCGCGSMICSDPAFTRCFICEDALDTDQIWLVDGQDHCVSCFDAWEAHSMRIERELAKISDQLPCHHTPDAWDFTPCPACPKEAK